MLPHCQHHAPVTTSHADFSLCTLTQPFLLSPVSSNMKLQDEQGKERWCWGQAVEWREWRWEKERQGERKMNGSRTVVYRSQWKSFETPNQNGFFSSQLFYSAAGWLLLHRTMGHISPSPLWLHLSWHTVSAPAAKDLSFPGELGHKLAALPMPCTCYDPHPWHGTGRFVLNSPPASPHTSSLLSLSSLLKLFHQLSTDFRGSRPIPQPSLVGWQAQVPPCLVNIFCCPASPTHHLPLSDDDTLGKLQVWEWKTKLATCSLPTPLIKVALGGYSNKKYSNHLYILIHE